jgi:HEPN domain-containing protein
LKVETQQWVDDAEYDFESAKAMLEHGRYFFVVFMCHLTIEKLLKAFIVEREGVNPPKVHNLVALVTRSKLTVPERHRRLINELNTMSVVTRYPDGRRALANTLDKARAAALYERTRECAQWLRHELG